MNYDKLNDHNLLKEILIRKGWRIEEWSAGEMLFRPDGGEVSSIIDILEIPDYVKKIEKAWELLREARRYIIDRTQDDDVKVILYPTADSRPNYWGIDKKVERAICKAWLEMKDHESTKA